MSVEGFIMRLGKNIIFFLLLLIMKLMSFTAYDVNSHDVYP